MLVIKVSNQVTGYMDGRALKSVPWEQYGSSKLRKK